MQKNKQPTKRKQTCIRLPNGIKITAAEATEEHSAQCCRGDDFGEQK